MVDYKCSQCGRVFDKKSNYNKHLRRVFSCKSETLIKVSEFVHPNSDNPNSPEFIDLSNSPPDSPLLSSNQLTKDLILSNKIDIQKTPTNIHTNKLKNKKHICPQCLKTFTRADNLNRHISTVCDNTPNKENIETFNDDTYEDSHMNLAVLGFNKLSHTTPQKKQTLTDMVSIMKKEIKDEILKEVQQETKKHKITNNNTLQVLCVKSDDNYLDMLTTKFGSFDKAIEYVKDCALSSLNGDCKLLGAIYLDPDLSPNRCPIRCLDRRRTKIAFVDENKKVVIDIGGIKLANKLANNIQNTYLKGVNYFISKNMPMKKIIEDYDVMAWNQHIYDLSSASYQKKLIVHMDIPYGPGLLNCLEKA